ncbi:uncharacterized protein [Leptinotarsa decemlineata]|uniref:uncharacterized protein n=1 Tax=Leptinotarsa decemlineata TaxID=7539 RepID=UPI003D306199
MDEIEKIEKQNQISTGILGESCAPSIDLLPKITQERCQKEYENFEEWRKSIYVKVVNEDVFLAYMKVKPEVYSPNSLWSNISMLKLALTLTVQGGVRRHIFVYSFYSFYSFNCTF